MPPILTPTQKTAMNRTAARCTDCLPLLEYLESLGLDMEEYRKRWELLRQQAQTALELNEIATRGGK